MPRRHSYIVGSFLLAALIAVGSCRLLSSDVFTISGRLASDFGCTLLTSNGKTYELGSWSHPSAPLGSFVVLRVRALHGYGSSCQVGEIVAVLRLMRVVTDFRTRPVTGAETWTPQQAPIVLGKVEVEPGATLTILPGTTVQIIPYGELRVRGTLQMVGTSTDSVRITGTSPDGMGGGPLVLDSVRVGTHVAFAVLRGLSVLGTGPDLEHLSALGITVREGSTTIRNSITRSLSASNATVTAESAELGSVHGVYGNFVLTGSTLSRLDLSYSSASVTDSRFTGERTYVLFHGQSGGTFERNSFEAARTDIVVRHTSDPVFHDNDLLSTHVVCETYALPTCIGMERNWWGTTDENQIKTLFAEDCSVCYVPWLTSPFGGDSRRLAVSGSAGFLRFE